MGPWLGCHFHLHFQLHIQAATVLLGSTKTTKRTLSSDPSGQRGDHGDMIRNKKGVIINHQEYALDVS